MTHKIDIQYFKESGKWYHTDILSILPEEYFTSEEKLYANMNDIGDRVIKLAKSKQLPGLVPCNWLEEGYIYITVEDIGYPRLLMQSHLENKPYIPLYSYGKISNSLD